MNWRKSPLVVVIPALVAVMVAVLLAGRGTLATTAPPSSQRMNVLLLGIDARVGGAQTRSDTLMVLSIVPATGELSLLSIPRDSRVAISGHGLDKINHAHAFGGVPLARETVSASFGLTIDHWVRVDMPGLVQMLSLLGPVTIDVPYPLVLDDGTRLAAGPVEMDTRLALLYVLERHSDPAGDIGRTGRAQQFILEAARQLSERVSPLDLPALYRSARKCVDTDLGLDDCLALARAVRSLDPEKVRRGTVPGRGVTLNGIWYYDVDWDGAEAVIEQLGLREQPAPPDGRTSLPEPRPQPPATPDVPLHPTPRQ